MPIRLSLPETLTEPPMSLASAEFGGVAGDDRVGQRRRGRESASRPPPTFAAELPLTVQAVRVIDRAVIEQAAAGSPAELPLIVQSVRFAGQLPPFHRPPPFREAELPLIVQPVRRRRRRYTPRRRTWAGVAADRAVGERGRSAADVDAAGTEGTKWNLANWNVGQPPSAARGQPRAAGPHFPNSVELFSRVSAEDAVGQVESAVITEPPLAVALLPLIVQWLRVAVPMFSRPPDWAYTVGLR